MLGGAPLLLTVLPRSVSSHAHTLVGMNRALVDLWCSLCTLSFHGSAYPGILSSPGLPEPSFEGANLGSERLRGPCPWSTGQVVGIILKLMTRS